MTAVFADDLDDARDADRAEMVGRLARIGEESRAFKSLPERRIALVREALLAFPRDELSVVEIAQAADITDARVRQIRLDQIHEEMTEDENGPIEDPYDENLRIG